MRIRLDKIASSTRNAELPPAVVLGHDIPAVPGAVVAVRVLDEKRTYNRIEDVNGRLMSFHEGDVVAGVLGSRRALRGYEGDLPEAVAPGDVLHLLNLGGVIGHCTSFNPEVGPPARVEVLGSVLTFPDPTRRIGVPACIAPGPIAPARTLAPMPPMVLFAGTSMHAGKTRAACTLVREATRRGLVVAAAKVTGVALRRDTLDMIDHGAVRARTFADAGLPSTVEGDVVGACKGVLNTLVGEEPSPDLLVVELGDGLMGAYGVQDILADDEVAAAVSGLVIAAPDPVASWGAAHLVDELGLALLAITGPATDNDAGSRVIRERIGVPAHNAVTAPEAFAAAVLDGLTLPGRRPPRPARPVSQVALGPRP